MGMITRRAEATERNLPHLETTKVDDLVDSVGMLTNAGDRFTDAIYASPDGPFDGEIDAHIALTEKALLDTVTAAVHVLDTLRQYKR